MPTPKRKTSKARRDQRQSTKFIRPQAITKCANCDHPLSPHQACEKCGFYKGKKVLTTKLERAIKRGEAARAKKAKVAKKEEEHGHEGHDHNHDNEKKK